MPPKKTSIASPPSPTARDLAKIDSATLRRKKVEEVEEEEEGKPVSVSAGAVDKAIDLAFNPSREKLREVTIIDRVQGRLFPIIDMIIAGRKQIIEVALYRQDKYEYTKVFKKKRPIPPNLLDEFLYRTAQWQKSVLGTNLTKITDIALAETETRAGEDGDLPSGADAWKE